jgi:hypothetical protein
MYSVTLKTSSTVDPLTSALHPSTRQGPHAFNNVTLATRWVSMNSCAAHEAKASPRIGTQELQFTFLEERLAKILFCKKHELQQKQTQMIVSDIGPVAKH